MDQVVSSNILLPLQVDSKVDASDECWREREANMFIYHDRRHVDDIQPALATTTTPTTTIVGHEALGDGQQRATYSSSSSSLMKTHARRHPNRTAAGSEHHSRRKIIIIIVVVFMIVAIAPRATAAAMARCQAGDVAVFFRLLIAAC